MKPITALLCTLFKALRNPHNYPEKRSAELQPQRTTWRRLDGAEKPAKSFQCLSEAVDFIAVCLETDATENLASEIENLKALLDADAGYAHYFTRSVFARLKKIHQENDLRCLYREREFPATGKGFRLGGHLGELGNIQIGFKQRDGKWVICDVWLTRQAPYGRPITVAADRSRRHRHRRDSLGSHAIASTEADAEFARQMNGQLSLTLPAKAPDTA
jgi:hypothetical protein